MERGVQRNDGHAAGGGSQVECPSYHMTAGADGRGRIQVDNFRLMYRCVTQCPIECSCCATKEMSCGQIGQV